MHLFYAEEVENYQVSFKRLPDVKKKFFETTLLDNLQLCPQRFNYRTLALAVTIRCSPFHAAKARYVPFKLGKYHSVVAFDNKDSGPRDWLEFRYNHYIPEWKVEDNAMTRFEKYTEQRQAAEQFEQLKDIKQAERQPQIPKDIQSRLHPSTSKEYTPHAGETQRWVLNLDQSSSSSSVQCQSDHETSNNTSNGKSLHRHLQQ